MAGSQVTEASGRRGYRAHVLSVRGDIEAERRIQAVWGPDDEIELTHVVCGVEALD